MRGPPSLLVDRVGSLLATLSIRSLTKQQRGTPDAEGQVGSRPTSIPELYTQKPPRFPSTARAVALCLRGGLLRRAVLERSRACLPLDAQRPRWGAFGALPVCRAQRTPITYDVSPATMLFKPALLSYRRNALAAPYGCPVQPLSFASLVRHPANVARRAVSRELASVMLLTRQAAHCVQKSSASRRCAIVSSTDITPLAVARRANAASAVRYSFAAAPAHFICSSLTFGASLAGTLALSECPVPPPPPKKLKDKAN